MTRAHDFGAAVKKAAWDLIDRECPIPGCQEQAKVVKDGKIELRGDVAHIISASDNPDAPRSPASLTAEERESFRLLIENRAGLENAIALCTNCHRKADLDTRSFDARLLFEAQQEAVHRGASQSGWTPMQRRGLASLSVDDFSDDPQRAEALMRVIRAHGTADLWQPYAEDPEGLAEVARSWQSQLAGEPWETAEYLARCAWRLGLWAETETLWIATAKLATQAEAGRAAIAEAWVLAAGAARRQGQSDHARDLVGRARALAPDEPVVVLSGVTSPMPLDELDVLEPLASAGERWRAWRHAHRALSYLLANDLERAEHELARIDRKLLPSTTVDSISLNYEVSRAREAVGEARPFEIAALQRACDKGRDLLSDLLARRRWSDAVRVRMLVARALLQLDQHWEAVNLLDAATQHERSDWEQRGVLAYAYIEAGEQAHAIKMIGTAHLDDDPATRADAIRLRVEAQTLYAALPEERAVELADELRSLREAPGWENLTAAAALASIAGASTIPWPPEADALLADPRNELPVTRLKRAIQASGRTVTNWRDALGDLRSDPATLRTLLVRLSARKAPGTTQADVATALLETDTHARARYFAAEVLMRHGASPHVGYGHMRAVARDRNAPAALRAQCYSSMLRHLRKVEDRDELVRVYEEARRLYEPGRSPRRVVELVNVWMPTAMRLRTPST